MKKLYSALALGAFAFCAFFFQDNLPNLIQWIKTLGLLAPVFFLLLYFLATLLFLPTMILTLAGGALFGPVLGTIFNLLGASLGAAGAFYISRCFMFDWLIKKKYSRINQFILGVEKRGWQFVAILRLVPIIPFNIVNYSLGMTRIKFSHYIATTMIFLIPTEIAFTYCGYAGMKMLNHPQTISNNIGLFVLLTIAILGLVVSQFKPKQPDQ